MTFRPAASLTYAEIMSEIEELNAKWDELIKDTEGHSGSPMEWLDERMGELEHERQRRIARMNGESSKANGE